MKQPTFLQKAKLALSPSKVSAMLSTMTILSDLSGHWSIGHFLSRPETAHEINSIIAAALALIAGFLGQTPTNGNN